MKATASTNLAKKSSQSSTELLLKSSKQDPNLIPLAKTLSLEIEIEELEPEELKPEIQEQIEKTASVPSEQDIAAFKRVILKEEADDVLSAGNSVYSGVGPENDYSIDHTLISRKMRKLCAEGGSAVQISNHAETNEHDGEKEPNKELSLLLLGLKALILPRRSSDSSTGDWRCGRSREFYVACFKDVQQSACKVIGQTFVKLVEPKEVTHHPYIKNNRSALLLPWWLTSTGEDTGRHREPDHLLKRERIKLQVHILRMIVEPPSKQHPSVHKAALDVDKAEDATMEAMSSWLEHPENQHKRPILKEIFKIAKGEERYKNGEIDPTTVFSVTLTDSRSEFKGWWNTDIKTASENMTTMMKNY